MNMNHNLMDSNILIYFTVGFTRKNLKHCDKSYFHDEEYQQKPPYFTPPLPRGRGSWRSKNMMRFAVCCCFLIYHENRK